MRVKKGFTLMEVLVSIVLFFLLMTIIFTAYRQIISFRYAFQVRSALLENTYYMLEKINLLLRDYTIDYEEYFNRRMVGCDLINDTSTGWNVGTDGSCVLFTAYGNRNTFLLSPLDLTHNLYYCSSFTGQVLPEYVIKAPQVLSGQGCAISGQQSFGEYANQFLDVYQNVDSEPSLVGDDDDKDLGDGPHALFGTTGVQELYLISQDSTHRMYLRRKLIETGDWNNDSIVSGAYEKLYSLQMLKLRSFDAGDHHDFTPTTSSGVYDGVVDTWACDYAQGFACTGASLGGVYSGYHLPGGANDGWVDLFDKQISVANRNIQVYPTKDPELAWSNSGFQMAPYFTVILKTVPYGKYWYKRLGSLIENFQFDLQTTFTTKNHYLNK